MHVPMADQVWGEKEKRAIRETLEQELPTLYGFGEFLSVSLISCSENLTFLVTLDEEKRILRVNREGYHSLGELEAELTWMTKLKRDVGLELPEVFAGKNGRYVQTLGKGVLPSCCMFSFLSGVSLHSLSYDAKVSVLQGVGTLAARMHLHSMQDAVSYDRFAWDWEALFGETRRWGDWKNYRGLLAEDVAKVERALLFCRDNLISYGKGNSVYGLIHSDLHVSNVMLSDEGTLQVIDFDDCGYGWYLYDIACSLVTYSEELDVFLPAVLQGYEQIRPLSEQDRLMLPLFVFMRRVARFAWLASHSESDTSKRVNDSLYRKVTMEICEKILKKGCQVWKD